MPNTTVSVVLPDFSMYEFYSSLAGANMVRFIKSETFEVNYETLLEDVKNSGSKIVILSNPCNPTGSVMEKTDLEKVTALIEVRVTPQRGQGFDNIAERIYKYPEVNSVYLISGGYDLLITLEGRSLKEISHFVSDKLSTLESVLSTATHFILKKYKDHGTILAKKSEDERMKITP